jgi:hypothetical protein
MSAKQYKNTNNALFIVIILTIYYVMCVAIFAAFAVGSRYENKNQEQYGYSSYKNKILGYSHPKLILGLEWGEYFFDTIDFIRNGRGDAAK